MIKRINLLVLLLCCGAASAQPGQYPVMDKVVQKVLEKYQNSSCQQLANEKSQRPSGKKAQMMDRAVQTLRNALRCTSNSSTASQCPSPTSCSNAA